MTLRSARLTAVGLGLSCLLLGAVIAASRRAPGTTELLRRTDHLLPAFDVEGVERLTILRPKTSEPALILERDPHDLDAFRIGAKDGKRADPGLVTALLRALDREKVQRRYDGPPTENGSALAEPDFELNIVAGERPTRVLLGRRHNYLIAQIVEAGGEPEYAALGLGLENQLDQSARDFTIRSLFPIAKSETRELRISREGSEILLRPSAFGFSIGEQGARADRDLVDALFFQLARSELEVVRDRASVEAAQAQDPGLVSIEQRGRSGGLAQIRFGGRCGPHDENAEKILALELGGEERAGCASGAIVAALAIEPERYLDKQVLPLKSDEIDHVTLDFQGETTDLLRKEDAFEVADANGRHPVDRETGSRLLRALSEVKGIRASTAKAPSESGVLRAIGHGPGELVIDEKVLFWRTDNQLFAMRGDGIVLALSESDAAPFEKASLWLREKTILRIDAAAITALNLASGSTLRRLERTPAGFRFAPGGSLSDARLTGEFLDVLSHLEARAFLDEGPPQTTPSLSIGFVGPEKAAVLAIYERRQGGFRATLTDRGVFLLDPLVMEKLGRSLESREPASFDLDEATRVVLDATGPGGKRRLELLRRDGALTPMFDEEAPPQSDISALLEAVSPLWARPDVPRPGPSEALLSLRIESEGKAEPFQLTFYKVPGIFPLGEEDLVAFSEASRMAFAFDERVIKRLLDSF